MHGQTEKSIPLPKIKLGSSSQPSFITLTQQQWLNKVQFCGIITLVPVAKYITCAKRAI
jgi:hypothetical protein